MISERQRLKKLVLHREIIGNVYRNSKMPLPDYGYSNMEKKTHQDIVFEMAPEIVSDKDETQIANGKNVKRVRGKVNLHGAEISIL